MTPRPALYLQEVPRLKSSHLFRHYQQKLPHKKFWASVYSPPQKKQKIKKEKKMAKRICFCTTNVQIKLSFMWKWTKSKNFLYLHKKIMRNYQSFLPDPIPIISYNCHSRCFTVISSCIKVRAWQKAPKEVVRLPVLHFAGGLMDCFQKKTSTFFTLCVHFRSSPEYMLIATVDKQTRKLNI